VLQASRDGSRMPECRIYLYLYGCIPKRSPVKPRRLFHCSPSHRTLFFATVSDHKTLFIPVSNSNGSRTLFITGTRNSNGSQILFITGPRHSNGSRTLFITGTNHCCITNHPLQTVHNGFETVPNTRHCFRTSFSPPLLPTTIKKNRPCECTGNLLVYGRGPRSSG
jgi:hypothetical protein